MASNILCGSRSVWSGIPGGEEFDTKRMIGHAFATHGVAPTVHPGAIRHV